MTISNEELKNKIDSLQTTNTHKLLMTQKKFKVHVFHIVEILIFLGFHQDQDILFIVFFDSHILDCLMENQGLPKFYFERFFSTFVFTFWFL